MTLVHLRQRWKVAIPIRNDPTGSTRQGGGPSRSISCSNYYRCRRRQMFTRLKRSLEGFEPADLFSSERVKNFQGSLTSRSISHNIQFLLLGFHKRMKQIKKETINNDNNEKRNKSFLDLIQ